MGNIKGWVNVHIDIETKKMFISNKPYSSKEEAELRFNQEKSKQLEYRMKTFEIKRTEDKD